MKKLRLVVDDLRVDSFVTRQETEDRGTVQGYVSARCTYQGTCLGGATCDGVGATCSPNDTCWFSCQGSCPCQLPDTITEVACEGIGTANQTCAPCAAQTMLEVNTCGAAQATCGLGAPCNYNPPSAWC